MFGVETKINGRWVRISNKRFTEERARNIMANLVAEVEVENASDLYRIYK